jgi:hypothetical protein
LGHKTLSSTISSAAFVTAALDPSHSDLIALNVARSDLYTHGKLTGIMKSNDVKPSKPSLSMYEIMQGKIVTFSDATECKSVTPYGEIYGVHPCLLKSTKDGMQHVTSNADPYTSKSGEIMRARTQRQQTTTDSAKAADAHSHRMKLIAAQKIPPHPRPHSEASISALTLED